MTDEDSLVSTLHDARGRFLCDREARRRAVGDGDASPTEERELLFHGVCLLASPKLGRGRRGVIVERGVCVVGVADAVCCAGRAREERGCAAAVEAVNNLVSGGPKRARDADARGVALALDRDDAINFRVAFEERRYPVFEQNVNSRMWQEAPERVERGRCENCVAN